MLNCWDGGLAVDGGFKKNVLVGNTVVRCQSFFKSPYGPDLATKLANSVVIEACEGVLAPGERMLGNPAPVCARCVGYASLAGALYRFETRASR